MKFKNIITALFVMLTAVIGYSCTEDADVAALETELSLSSTYFGPTQEGGEQVVSISSNAEWTISQSADTDWMAIDNNSGSNNGDFTITVDPNLTVSAREVTLIVTSGEVSEIVLVSQEMGDENVTFLPAEQLSTSRSAKEDISFAVTANTIWDASVSYETGDEEWVTLLTQTGSGETEVGVTVTENPLVSDRTATVSFLTASNTTYTYKIVQSFGDATIELSELAAFDGWEQSKWVTVTSNDTWVVTNPTGDDDWVTIATSTGSSEVKGAGNGTFQVTVGDNPTAKTRTVTLNVSCGTVEADEKQTTLDVVQNGAASTLAVADPQYADFSSAGGSVTFDVTSNDTWVVSNLPEGYTVVYYGEDKSETPTGEYNGSFTITAPANETDPAISQNIVVTCEEDSDKFLNIPVSQTSAADDAKLSVSITGNEDVVAVGTTLTVTISGSDAWKAEVEYDGTNYYDTNFLTLGATSGSAATNLSVTVVNNNNQDARIGTIIITSTSGVTRKVSVSQVAGEAFFNKSIENYNSQQSPIPAAGGEFDLKVVTNAVSWFTEYWISWLTFADGTYSYDQSLTLNVEENMTFSKREGTIYINNITGLDSNSNYIVYQAASTGSMSLSEVEGNSFNTATDVIKIENTGGDITLKVKSNVDYDVTYEYESDDYKDFISLTTSYDDYLDYVKILKFAVAESENYEAATEVNTLTDTGYIVIKPTSSAASSYTDIASTEIKIKVTLGAFMAEDPTYAVSKVSSTELKVEIENTKFKADPSFSTSDFEVSYKNDYAGSTVKSGTLAVSAVAWDSANPSYVTLTVGTMYNTDEVTVEYVGSTSSIVLANNKDFGFDEGVIGTDYVEYLYATFETEGEDTNFFVAENCATRDGLLKHLDGTTSLTDTYYANPYKDGINTSDRCFYNAGSDDSTKACFVFCSDGFDMEQIGDRTLTISLKYCLVDENYLSSENSDLGIAFNPYAHSSTQGDYTASTWTYTGWGWSSFGVSVAGTWREKTCTITENDDATEISLDQMSLTMRYNSHKSAFLYDDIVFGDAEARTE